MTNKANTKSDSRDKTETPATDSTKATGDGLPWGLLAALFVLAVVAILGFLGYDRFHLVQNEMAVLKQQIQQQNEGLGGLTGRLDGLHADLGAQGGRMDELKNQFSSAETSLRKERERYTQSQADMHIALNAIQRLIGRSTSRWMAAEAEYLIRVANHRLQLEADVKTALKALEAADERLRDSGDPLWIPVREVLAQDIATLRGIQPMDEVGLAIQLSALSPEVDKLPIRTALLNNPLRPMAKQPEPSFSLKQVMNDGWEGFRSLMIIRRHDQPVSAMLPPEQRFFLGQNLKLKLEAAHLALLRRDQGLYDNALATARQWLAEYYDPESPVTQGMKETLEGMSKVKIRPSLPDVSGAMAVLVRQMDLSRERSRQEAAKAQEEKPTEEGRP